MKNRVVYPAALACLLVLVQCKKSSQESFIAHTQPDQFITASVSSGKTYTFVGSSSETLTITHQALHYQVSEAGTDSHGSPIYSYNSAPGYIGSDEVTLACSKIAVESENSRCPNHSEGAANIIAIKFNVSN